MALLLTNKERGHFTDRPPWSKYWSDSFDNKVPWYSELHCQRKNLVICYGDSWTWGDSLGKASASRSIADSSYREKHIYASRLADKLEADFINCAIPGIFNFWIHDRLQILIENDIDRLSSKYDHIWIIVTLTELGREFNFQNYLLEFQKFYDYNQKSPKDILLKAEEFDFVNLQNIADQLPKNVTMCVGRNFTHTFEKNKPILKNLMPQSWVDVLFDKQGLSNNTKIPLMSFGIERFDKWVRSQRLDSIEYKQWMNDVILPDAEKILDILNQSVYNSNKGSKHPTEQGHALWADYIYNYINKTRVEQDRE